eukprot:TRINITY_DN77443_c0_g1_i1.p1 TRINITY_DN77443_c0_g1~~TRINITY_DN77443_c0_g1_i1.p1  ORF type:complete len:358 (-),score=98.85 TRINITY_DN77443_c0_g1_i1:10-1062(-)
MRAATRRGTSSGFFRARSRSQGAVCVLPLLAVCSSVLRRSSAFAALAGAMPPRLIDSHIHLWTPDVDKYKRADGAPPIPAHLEAKGTAEEMHKAMTATGVTGTLVVQPVNYGQDYSYILDAKERFPGFFKGMFVADPAASDPVGAMKALKQSDPDYWVGVRFNPYKWPDAKMDDTTGMALFEAAGELRLPVGFMPFKGLNQHIDAIEALMKYSPKTQVVIDHWGFIVQPATGMGERALVEESWTQLKRLGREYPQVHVKTSAPFRNSLEKPPFEDLNKRLEELIEVFGSERVMFGSDAPYFFDFADYSGTLVLTQWPIWEKLSEEQKADILYGTAEKLFGKWPAERNAEL